MEQRKSRRPKKAPFKVKDIRAIRVRLQIGTQTDLALFNLRIVSKLRACDLLKLRVRDVSLGGVTSRAIVLALLAEERWQWRAVDATLRGIWQALSLPVQASHSAAPLPPGA